MRRQKVILVLGSNTNQADNIGKARLALTSILPDIIFSKNIWTEPVGMVTDKFLNCMGIAHATSPLTTLRKQIKDIEMALGNKDHTTNTIHIDIDLLQYGSHRYKEEDWKRNYVSQLKNDIM